MELAFCLYKYFPFGGLQRDFLRIAQTCRQLGYGIRVYTLEWEGEIPEAFDVIRVPVQGLSNHKRYEFFSQWVQGDLARRPVARVIGFNKMPGLDVYYAADACFEDKARHLRGPLYRFTRRYRHFATFEKAVFTPDNHTRILLLSARQQPLFIQYYHTQPERFHVLPPGISRDRRRMADAAQIRLALREEFSLDAVHDKLLLQIGSGFKTKGLDRSLAALAALPAAVRAQTRFIVIGQDDARPFQRMAKTLGVDRQVIFLAGRSDVPRFLAAADVLIHPAYNENTGTVLLEAVVAGLPVLTTDSCGYAHYISEARAGVVVPQPFSQMLLNTSLGDMLENPQQLLDYQRNGLAFAETADIYDMPERAAAIILEGL